MRYPRIYLVVSLFLIVGCGRFWGNLDSQTQETGVSDGNTSVCSGSGLTASPYASGSGTTSDPYVICTVSQWDNLGSRSQDWGLNFKLGLDLDFSSLSSTYKMIGNSTTKFTGSFNGNGYALKNLTLNSSTGNLAIFGYSENASISNLNLNNINVTRTGTGSAEVAALVAVNDNSLTLTSLTATQINVTSSTGYVGGLVSSNNGRLSCSTCTMSSVNLSGPFVGGLASYSNSLTVQNFSIDGLTVTTTNAGDFGGIAALVDSGASSITSASIRNLIYNGDPDSAGGFIGSAMGGTVTISTASVAGTLTSTDGSGSGSLAGLIGRLYSSTPGVVSYANIEVTVSSTSYAGGLIARWDNSLVITNSRVYGSVTGNSNSGGLAGFSSTGSINLSDSYVRANVAIAAGRSGVGGILATMSGGQTIIERTYFAGSVSGNTVDNARGCIFNTVAVLTSSDNYYDSSLCTLGKGRQSGAMAGTTGQMTSLMQPASAFSNWSTGVWVFSGGSYPRLIWE